MLTEKIQEILAEKFVVTNKIEAFDTVKAKGVELKKGTKIKEMKSIGSDFLVTLMNGKQLVVTKEDIKKIKKK